jgi:hypothetical protein
LGLLDQLAAGRVDMVYRVLSGHCRVRSRTAAMDSG